MYPVIQATRGGVYIYWLAYHQRIYVGVANKAISFPVCHQASDGIARDSIECVAQGGNCCGHPLNIGVVRRWMVGDVTGPQGVQRPSSVPPCSNPW